MASTQATPTTLPRQGDYVPAPSLGGDADGQRERLLVLRAQLSQERERAISPAVARALEMAETYLFLGLGYVGHTDELFPNEVPPTETP